MGNLLTSALRAQGFHGRKALDMGRSPVEIGMVAWGLYETCGIPLHKAFSTQIPGQLSRFKAPEPGS